MYGTDGVVNSGHPVVVQLKARIFARVSIDERPVDSATCVSVRMRNPAEAPFPVTDERCDAYGQGRERPEVVVDTVYAESNFCTTHRSSHEMTVSL